MPSQSIYKEDSQSVRTHLEIQQSVIQRMAANSASSKTWCISIVSAILVIVINQEKPHNAFIAYIPTFLFLFLDTYYLALESMFRSSYNSFIDKLHSNRLKKSDFYTVSPVGNLNIVFFRSLLSPSIFPFYLVIFGLVFIIGLT